MLYQNPFFNGALIVFVMLSVAVKAAKTAGKLLKKNFGLAKEVSYKADNEVVSNSDKASERIILDAIGKAFPEHSVFSEEAGASGNSSDFQWIVDPLDGTTNFVNHFPHFCVSIALAHKGEIVLGVVYEPLLDELFTAEMGKGAFLNGKKIRVNDCSDISKAVAVICRGSSKLERERNVKLFSALSPNVYRVRGFGAAALDLCYFACGRFEAVAINGSQVYDFAAGSLIAGEAGGILTDFRGNSLPVKYSDVLASNKQLRGKFFEIVKGV